MRIWVSVRKRILFEKEAISGQIDCVDVQNPIIRVGEPKFKIDGITKYIDNNDYIFDNAFSDAESSEDIYQNCV